MGFFQGVAKAVGEISEENFTRKERQKDRDLQTQRDQDAFEREKQLAKYRSELETRQSLLLAGLKSGRSGDSDKTDSYVSASQFVLGRVEGVEGNKDFVNAIKKDPSLAPDVAEYIADLEKNRGMTMTPQEIIDSIILIPGAEGEDRIISLMGEDFTIPGGKQSGFVGPGPGAYDKPSEGDIERAEQAFMGTMIDQAQNTLNTLSVEDNAEEYTKIQGILNSLESTDDTTRMLARKRLVDLFGGSVVEDFKQEIEVNPYLRGIYRSPDFGKLFRAPSTEEVQSVPFREKLKTVADNWANIPEGRRQELLTQYPEIRDFLDE